MVGVRDAMSLLTAPAVRKVLLGQDGQHGLVGRW